ncbi:hypothetical protein FRC10_011489 [Ceratobasidium sp. 414]|nr:hypothetical protein FRC10_011489 [Ceratobasidium sp. 414]
MNRALPLAALSTGAITLFGYLSSPSTFVCSRPVKNSSHVGYLQVQGCYLGFCLWMCIVYAYHLSHRYCALLGTIWTEDVYPVVSLCVPLVSIFHSPPVDTAYF